VPESTRNDIARPVSFSAICEFFDRASHRTAGHRGRADRCAWFPSARLGFDQSIESLYAEDDPHLRAFLKSKMLFGGDEFAFVAYTDPDLYSPESQERLRNLAKRLAEVPGIQKQSVQDLASTLRHAKIPLVRISEDKIKEIVPRRAGGQ